MTQAAENRDMSSTEYRLKIRQDKAASLLEIRKEANLTQRAAAAAAGISQALYNELERGKHDILPRHVEALERAFGYGALDRLR